MEMHQLNSPLIDPTSATKDCWGFSFFSCRKYARLKRLIINELGKNFHLKRSNVCVSIDQELKKICIHK